MNALSPSWVIITIGNRKYAINTAYIQSIIELNTVLFKEPFYKNTFVKGTYDIHGAVINILDGRKLICETTIDEKKMQFAREINNLRCEHEAWLDSIEWELLTGDKLELENKSDLKLKEFLDNSIFSDKQISRLVDKMRQPYDIIHQLADRAIKARRNSGGLNDAMKSLDELRRQSENYIVKNLDKIIDLNNGKLTEMCVIVKAKELIYGISIDAVDMITEQTGNLSNTEKTKLSAGQIQIKGETYNVLNLTKLAKILL